jgi:lantibiotic modifying enzyme
LNDGSRFLAVADTIGAQLAREAIWDGNRCNWIGSHVEVISGRFVPAARSFGPDLYTGTAGIALFLAYLHKFTGEKIFRVVAEGAMAQAKSVIAEWNYTSRLGFYAGTAGIAWSMRELGTVFGRQDLYDDSANMMKAMCLEAEPWNLDVMTGAAGTIFGMLKILRDQDDHQLLDAANELGRRILLSSNHHSFGCSWTTLPDGMSRDLTGLSHGAAGVALALLELGILTKESAYIAAAELGFAYEDHWFRVSEGNWLDFRSKGGALMSSDRMFDVAWCHGAPGIGLSRLRAYQVTGNEKYRLSAEAAISTTHKFAAYWLPGWENFSLCHGQSGNAELFIYAEQVFGEERYRELAEWVGYRGLDVYDHLGLPWPCGVEGRGETPGLMLGLAGIGYFYLRLFDLERTPSVLLPL